MENENTITPELIKNHAQHLDVVLGFIAMMGLADRPTVLVGLANIIDRLVERARTTAETEEARQAFAENLAVGEAAAELLWGRIGGAQ